MEAISRVLHYGEAGEVRVVLERAMAAVESNDLPAFCDLLRHHWGYMRKNRPEILKRVVQKVSMVLNFNCHVHNRNIFNLKCSGKR